jgi:hypothetical protein
LDWYDGGGEIGGGMVVADAGVTALLGVPGLDSHTNGTVPAPRL